MASLWKHPESRYWFACFTAADGRRLKRSTKATDRPTAQRLADEYEAAARRKRTARQARAVIADLHERITGEALPDTTLRAFVKEWLERKAPETTPATLTFYRSALTKFMTFIGDRADVPLAEITAKEITAFRNHETKTLAGKTVNHDLKCLRSLFKAARRDGLLSEDPTEFVDVVKEKPAQDFRPFTMDELEAVLRVADDEWRSLIKFGFYTGQRLSDLAALTWSNISIENGHYQLVTRKTGKRMNRQMPAPLLRHIATLPSSDKQDAPLHPRAFGVLQRTGNSGGLSVQFGALLARAGLREKKTHKSTGKGRSARRERNSLTFHSLRRTATTLLHEAGIPASVAQDFIGHDSEEIHRTYVSIGREALGKAAEAFPELP